MKRWLVQVGGVEPVESDIIIGNEVAVRTVEGHTFMASTSDLFQSESAARREHVDRKACALEEEADRHDRQRVDAEVLASRHMDDAKWNADKAAECRARAKGLRDVLEEVKDAMEGRR